MNTQPTGIKITPEEHKQLLEMYNAARSTPVMMMGRGHRINIAQVAWDAVQKYMDGLAGKYGYEADKHAIDKEGNVMRVL